MTKTVEAAIQRVHAEGARVNNLFELREEMWQANINVELAVFGFGQAKTPHEALARAIVDLNVQMKSEKGKRALSDVRRQKARKSPELEKMFKKPVVDDMFDGLDDDDI